MAGFSPESAAYRILAFGLVLTTTVAAAWVAHTGDTRPPVGAALILAQSSPPRRDRRDGGASAHEDPRRIVAVLEGESLVNDSIARGHRFGIAAVVTDRSPPDRGAEAPIVGLRVLSAGLSRWRCIGSSAGFDDRPCRSRFRCSPFAAYLPAEQLGLPACSRSSRPAYIGWRSLMSRRTRLGLRVLAHGGLL
jgi:CPA1 family monovalent cation:H+ antiporter